MRPVYSQSSGGLPVNLSQGAVITESRGIFLQGLNYSVGNNELAALLNRAGLRPDQAHVHRDARGTSKGVATAKFSTKAEAEYAVSALNGKSHAGKTLTVRMDTNSTVVGSLEPFVVDGTNKSGVSYRVHLVVFLSDVDSSKRQFREAGSQKLYITQEPITSWLASCGAGSLSDLGMVVDDDCSYSTQVLWTGNGLEEA